MLSISQFALSKLKVGGEIYGQIVLGKDLVADILPPPEYIIEPYLEATLALKTPAEAETRIGRLNTLRKDFETRHDYWLTQPLDETLKRGLVEGAYAPALRFWEITEKTFVPALRAGDLAGAAKAYEALTQAYDEHRARIDEVVQGANAFIAVTEQNASHADTVTMILVWGVSLLVLALVVAAAAGLLKGILSPLKEITAAMGGLANGHLETEVPFSGRADEIGEMAKALQVFKDALIAKQKADEDAQREAAAKLARAQRLSEITQRFDKAVTSIISSVAAASTSLGETAAALSESATTVAAQSSTIAASSEEASQSVTSVASSTEELSSAIHEISRQVNHASAVAEKASMQSEETTRLMNNLKDAASRVGAIVELIRGVASQTNLLALNATIEAARAGEAGRGFAVVAQEVKALSDQTTKATEEIDNQISAIQFATERAFEHVSGISKTIGDMNQISTAIAAAVEEQGAVTEEISLNVRRVSEGTTGVAQAISGVAASTEGASANATQVLSSAQNLSQQSALLRDEVEQFLAGVRAA